MTSVGPRSGSDQEADFYWRVFPDWGGRVEHPTLRQPVSLVVDDPNPGFNPAYFHLGFRHGPLLVPRTLIDEFAELVEANGIRGKFSVIPYPFGLGRIDREVEGLTRADVDYFLDTVRARIAPAMDITPEALTHWNALDLETGQLLPFWEHVWSRAQDRRTLLPYLSLALEIMNNVDLPCLGMTSPWDFGAGVEDEYAEAQLASQQSVNGNSFTWYFLQMDATSRHVPPRLTVLRPERGEAVVSLVACDRQDFGRGVWAEGEAHPDELITADGQHGRLAEVLGAGGPAVFHTHWQTMFSRGSRSGLQALGEVTRRLHEHFGDRIVWTRLSDLARYTAASAALQLEPAPSTEGTLVLATRAPFTCDHFTISLDLSRPVRSVSCDGRPFSRVATSQALTNDSYMLTDQRLYLCWELEGEQRLTIQWA